MGTQHNREIRQTARVEGDGHTVVVQSLGDVTGTVIGAVTTATGTGRVGRNASVSVTQHGGATYVNGRKVADDIGSLEISNGRVYVNGKRVV